MKVVEKYFPDISTDQHNKFLALGDLYSEWNQQINVVSRKDIDHLYLRHILHSLAIAKYVSFVKGTKILDVGTGGGFPGIPLAIMFPECEFQLVDSIGKKIKVVQAIINALNLKNCEAHHTRAEKVPEKFDFIVSRAVTAMPTFISWVGNSITNTSNNTIPNGILALKGGDLSFELNIPQKSDTINLTNLFEEDFFETKKLVHVFW